MILFSKEMKYTRDYTGSIDRNGMDRIRKTRVFNPKPHFSSDFIFCWKKKSHFFITKKKIWVAYRYFSGILTKELIFSKMHWIKNYQCDFGLKLSDFGFSFFCYNIDAISVDANFLCKTTHLGSKANDLTLPSQISNKLSDTILRIFIRLCNEKKIFVKNFLVSEIVDQK